MWTLPNLLTLSRIVAVAPVSVAIWHGWAWLACALFVAAAATDWLDGRIARARGDVSELGRFLDPLADKIMVAAVLVVLIAVDVVAGASVVAVVAILVREVAVSGLREYLGPKGVVVHVSAVAKWKTATQLGAIALLLAEPLAAQGFGLLSTARFAVGIAGIGMLWIAAALAWLSAWGYFRAGLGHMGRA